MTPTFWGPLDQMVQMARLFTSQTDPLQIILLIYGLLAADILPCHWGNGSGQCPPVLNMVPSEPKEDPPPSILLLSWRGER